MPLHDDSEEEENEAADDSKDLTNVEDGNANMLPENGGGKSPSKNGKLEGIVIHATPKTRIKNGGSGGLFGKRNTSKPRNLHNIESAATLRARR